MLATLLAAMGFAGCNSEKEDIATVSYSSVAVEGFSLAADGSVLANLDSVFFTIDLNNALIFNADSLPVGTDVSKLVVKVNTTSVGGVELIVPRPGMTDSVYNYLANQHDSIDFSHGPVTLRITSQDRMLTRDYRVSVNVHLIQPDSLSWNLTQQSPLPTTLTAPTVARAVEFGGKTVVVSADAAGNACVATADNPSDRWTTASATLPAGADVMSLAAGADALYMTTASGELYTAADAAGPWTPTGALMNTVYGVAGTKVLGARLDGSVWKLVTYPASTETEAPAAFPVGETSQLLVYTTSWSDRPTAIMAGGRTADGGMTGDTWAWDGEHWACINNAKNRLPACLGPALVPYFAYKTSTNWQVSRESVILAIGGQLGLGLQARTVYISWDRGITWLRAPQSMQLPADMSIGSSQSAIVADTKISRAERPVTQWDCPYIYLIGGFTHDGKVFPDIRRAVINRLSFKPLY